MRIGSISGFLLVATILAGPAMSQTPRTGGAGDQAIAGVADAYVKASLAGDVKAMVALYTDDAIEMPPNQPAVRGRAAIEQYYVKEMAAAKLTWRFPVLPWRPLKLPSRKRWRPAGARPNCAASAPMSAISAASAFR